MAEVCGWCAFCHWDRPGFEAHCEKCGELPIDPAEPACNDFLARDAKTEKD